MTNCVTLNPYEVHLWSAVPDEIQDNKLLTFYSQLMTSSERDQYQRFHFAKHRHQYLITRALVRTTLSRYADVAPEQWRFSKNAYGRPEIVYPTTIPPLRFNLSHTDGLIICGVVLQQDLGVDVENLNRSRITPKIAEGFFSTQEIKDLFSIPAPDRLARFFDYWVLKESYIKAVGMGLSLSLKQFTFHLNESIRISFHSSWHDDPNNWQFWLLQLTAQHRIAISVRRNWQPLQLIIN